MRRSDRPTSPEPPESDIQDAVLQYLALDARVAWVKRFNTGSHVVVSTTKTGKKSRRFIRYAFTGCADILGQLADGRFLAIECKRRTGRLKPAQAAFLETVNRAGGLGIVARCIEDVAAELRDDQRQRQRRKSA